jgi:Ca2+-binding RTX toxin-like protein
VAGATRPLAAAVPLALAVVALGPVASVPASTVRSENGVITYQAAPGEANRLTLDEGPSGNTITVVDSGAVIVAGPGCTSSGTTAVCEQRSDAVANLGDRDDTMRVPPDNHGELTAQRGSCCSPAFGDPIDLRATLGSGNDTIAVAFVNVVTIAAGSGDDSVWSWSFASLARGGTGNDLLALSVDPGDAYGEAGNDRIVVDADGGGTLDGGSGDDRLTAGGTEPSFTFNGRSGHDELNLLCNDPRCRVPVLGEFVDAYGGPDNDLIRAFRRPDTPESSEGFGHFAIISGGTGADLVDYRKSTADLSITLDDVQNDGDGVGEQDNVRSDVESVLSGSGNDRLVGSALANHLDGFAGNDDLTGGHGEDKLLGHAGNDVFRSQDGEFDRLFCGLGFDRAFRDRFDFINNCERF